jgi:hypothetical protein
MTKFQISTTVFGCIVLGMFAAIPPVFFSMIFLASVSAVVLIYKISNSIEKGFNEHTKAMQAIYEELVRANQSVKRPGSSS